MTSSSTDSTSNTTGASGSRHNGSSGIENAGAKPAVIFMHVPDLSASESKLREGREVSVALIKALVESRRKVGVGRGEQKAGGVEQEDDARNNTVV